MARIMESINGAAFYRYSCFASNPFRLALRSDEPFDQSHEQERESGDEADEHDQRDPRGHPRRPVCSRKWSVFSGWDPFCVAVHRALRAAHAKRLTYTKPAACRGQRRVSAWSPTIRRAGSAVSSATI